MPTNTSNGRAKAVRAAAHAANEDAHKPLTEITLKNGIVLGIKPVPPFLIRRAVQGLPRPKPPTYRNEATGKDEENLLSPEYERALTQWQQETFEVGSNVMVIAGTWVISVPDGVAPVESDEWLELVEYLRISPELNCWKCADSSPVEGCAGCKKARYLSWLSLYAIQSEVEWVQVLTAVARQAGISEEEVLEALGSFRSGAQRGADNGASLANIGNGNNVQEEPTASSS